MLPHLFSCCRLDIRIDAGLLRVDSASKKAVLAHAHALLSSHSDWPGRPRPRTGAKSFEEIAGPDWMTGGSVPFRASRAKTKICVICD